MFPSRRRKSGFHSNFMTLLTVLLGVVLIAATPALVPDASATPPEKGKKCSDGIDNDGDGKIDAEDPDCADDGDGGGGGGGKPSGGGEIPASLLFDDLSGDLVTSDGFFSYLDGTDGVASTVDGGSDYDLTLGKRNRPADRGVRYSFTNQVASGSCVGSECNCSALVANTIESNTGFLRVNIEPDGQMCGLGVGETRLGRATAQIGSCRVAWNPDAPGAPVPLDAVAIERTAADTWVVTTTADSIAWLWSEGRRGTRIDEGTFSMPFGATINAECLQ